MEFDLVKSEVTQCSTLCDPVDCSPPGSSIHEILQARTLEWVAISFSKLQDIKLTQRNPFHSYILTVKKTEKLRKQSHSPLQQNE